MKSPSLTQQDPQSQPITHPSRSPLFLLLSWLLCILHQIFSGDYLFHHVGAWLPWQHKRSKICSDLTFALTTPIPEEARHQSMLIVQILCHSSCDRQLTYPSHTVEPEDALIRNAVGPFHRRVQEIYASVGEALGFMLALVGVENRAISTWQRGYKMILLGIPKLQTYFKGNEAPHFVGHGFSEIISTHTLLFTDGYPAPIKCRGCRYGRGCFLPVANAALRAPVAVLQRFGTELMDLVIKVVLICKK
jgi:hypothetical protein